MPPELTAIGRHAALLAGLMVAACAGAPGSDTASMQRYTLLHDGLEREYFLFDPGTDARAKRQPVLVFLHGYGGSATGTEAETTNGLNRYAARYGYRVVYPQGSWFIAREPAFDGTLVTSWNDGAGNRDTGPAGPLCTDDATRYPCPPECGDCGRCGWTSCHDDEGFLLALLDALAAREDVTISEFFLAGFSNGAMMAQRLACAAPERFAAVALIGGRLERGYNCAPQRPLALLQINGGRDTVVPVTGALPDSEFFYTSAADVGAAWAQGCAESGQAWPVPDGVPADVRCDQRCDRPANVSCLWPEGGHTWPGVPVRGSYGYCVTELQAGSLPRETRCVPPDPTADVWGSRLLFEFYERVWR